jgi:antitoxin component HigA of HigAB toxin-antitoxin module
MIRSHLPIAALLLALASATSVAADPRERVTLPEPMVDHMMANMRDHLQAVNEIQRALAAGDYQRAADVAEKRIGLSSLAAHGASHMAPFMPQPMQDIGTRMHQAASQFALLAQDAGADGNVARAIGGLSRITEQCVACHAAYRIH